MICLKTYAESDMKSKPSIPCLWLKNWVNSLLLRIECHTTAAVGQPRSRCKLVLGWTLHHWQKSEVATFRRHNISAWAMLHANRSRSSKRDARARRTSRCKATYCLCSGQLQGPEIAWRTVWKIDHYSRQTFFLCSHRSWTCSHVTRNCNRAAHNLAKWASSCNYFSHIDLQRLPLTLLNLLIIWHLLHISFSFFFFNILKYFPKRKEEREYLWLFASFKKGILSY